MDKELSDIVNKIYIIFIECKLNLHESLLNKSPKSYVDRFKLSVPFECDIEILDYLISKRSYVNHRLSNQCFRDFVININKLISEGRNDDFSLIKLYTSISNKNLIVDLDLSLFEDFNQLRDIRGGVLYNINLLRNKHLAHKDKEVDNINSEDIPTYNESFELIKVIEKLLKNIHRSYEVDLRVEGYINFDAYWRDFKKIYVYYQNSTSISDLWALRDKYGSERVEAFQLSKI